MDIEIEMGGGFCPFCGVSNITPYLNPDHLRKVDTLATLMVNRDIFYRNFCILSKITISDSTCVMYQEGENSCWEKCPINTFKSIKDKKNPIEEIDGMIEIIENAEFSLRSQLIYIPWLSETLCFNDWEIYLKEESQK